MTRWVERGRVHGFHLWAWGLMPGHVHRGIWDPNAARRTAILKSITLSVARNAIRWLRESVPEYLDRLEHRYRGSTGDRFRQTGGGYERLLRRDTNIQEKIRYVHANPVRRGLVDRPLDWP